METNTYRIMRLDILFCFLVWAVLSCSCVRDRVKFGPLCSGNKDNTKRGCDVNYGCGHYGASRGSRKHMGLDIVCTDGAYVYAPFDVRIIGRAKPYGNNNAIDDGITLMGEGLCFKLFYVQPDLLSGTKFKYEKIGSLLPMQKVYPGITSHVHVQMCDKSDPTEYF
ncbi:leukocyte cell-derived chemotaxin-2 [Danio rerio]|uniref:Leukocyte cell-derived chemotaxin-2 n=1 Tax=Danio rerio TaxID=7955 RepID=E7F1W2_DANRE|nr:leukocyte cell-derived chemotaxin-2-like [Danio rerio]|eukprot:XP_001332975.2 leukocyte cell-derived chemotaxin-2-like [Danio rerio]